MNFEHQIYIELIKTVFALLILGVTWFIGQRILTYWEIKKKRKELDIATATQFQQLYGEYREVWRLWKVFCKPYDKQITFPENTRWSLLERATSAESKFEAIIVKMATEQILAPAEARSIGLLRQGFQKLRESIRDGKYFDYSYKMPEYILFNNLSCEVAMVISSDNKEEPSNAGKASDNFINVTKVRSKDWDDEILEVSNGLSKNPLLS